MDQSRVDKQSGATATGTDSTNLASLPSAPQLLGLGVELGALTQTVSGSVATFRGNADGMIRAIAGQPISCIGCSGTNGLKNLTFAVSFDLSRGTSQQVTASVKLFVRRKLGDVPVLKLKNLHKIKAWDLPDRPDSERGEGQTLIDRVETALALQKRGAKAPRRAEA